MPEFEFIAAPFTPMHPDRSIKLEAIKPYCDFLAHNGVRGAFVNGATGEGISLTTAERPATVERWVAAAPAGFRIFVHVGHLSLEESRELAVHARETDANPEIAIATLPPLFFKPENVDALIAYCAELAAAVPELPFYYYHIPALSGVEFPMAKFLEAARDRIPSLRGLKFTFEDLADFADCLTLDGGRFEILYGRDQMLLAALSLGARGAVGSTYNLAVPLYLKLVAAFNGGDIETARECQAKSREFITVTRGHEPGNSLGAYKAVMSMLGIDCGPARPPLKTLTKAQTDALRRDLDAIGFFDYSSKLP